MDDTASSPPTPSARAGSGRAGRRLDRRQVLDEAAALLHDQGPQALTVRTVAERAQVSVQAVYTLFGGKPGLCEALFAEGFAQLRSSLDAVGVTADPLADVLNQVHAYRAAALTSPGFYAIMYSRPVPEFRPSAAALTQARATIGGLVDALRRAAVPRPEQSAQIVWGLNHGLVSLELDGHLPGGEPGRTRLDGAVRALLRSWT